MEGILPILEAGAGCPQATEGMLEVVDTNLRAGSPALVRVL
jgi:hypothetical protein